MLRNWICFAAHGRVISSAMKNTFDLPRRLAVADNRVKIERSAEKNKKTLLIYNVGEHIF